MRFVTDTHSLVWYLQDSPRLSIQSKLLFEEQVDPRDIVVPAIVLAEMLYISRKANLPVSFEKTFDTIKQDERFDIYPLSADVIEKAIPLKKFEMHDALIMATSLHLGIPLMTVDGEIVDSGLVKTI